MPLLDTPAWNWKHAWQEVPRIQPIKRLAEERVTDYHEIYALYDEENVRAQASRCLQCPEPLCKAECPLSNRIPEWLALAAEGRFLEAAEISQSTSNMPEICSRVCPQERLCESGCFLNGRAEPVAIGAVEKFINEYAIERVGIETSVMAPNGFGVAVIGSGPGGLACADELAKLGYSVTIFESEPVAGGLLMNGIPSFKLDKSVVQRRIDALVKRGVVFRLGVKIGTDISLSELRTRYDAVFIGVGAQKPKPFRMPGVDLHGIYEALPFLAQKNLDHCGNNPAISVEGKRVAVLGGGDTAMDCLRTSIRAGATQAICLYRRDLANMPGNRREYVNAIEEGAEFRFLTNPVRLIGNTARQVTQVECVQMELGDPDASGRRKPRSIHGSEIHIDVDVVLVAYGFDPEPLSTKSGFKDICLNKWGTIQADVSQMTNLADVFAGGDIVRGPSLVVQAVRDGRTAAAGIHRSLSGSGRLN